MESLTKELIICPKCGKDKNVESFGHRQDANGNIKLQSWCKKCRMLEKQRTKM